MEMASIGKAFPLAVQREIVALSEHLLNYNLSYEDFFGLFQKVSLTLKTQGFVINPTWFVAVTKQALVSTSPSLYFTQF